MRAVARVQLIAEVLLALALLVGRLDLAAARVQLANRKDESEGAPANDEALALLAELVVLDHVPRRGERLTGKGRKGSGK